MVDDVVQGAEGTQGVASKEGEASESGKTTEKVETTPTAGLTEERVQQLIAEATRRVAESAREEGRREMQARKDREVAEAKRQARLAEGRAKGIESGLSGLDEESRQILENARLKGENQQFQTLAQEEEAKKTHEAFLEQLHISLNTHLEALGVDTKDKRIDWAEDAPDFLAGRSRFDASVAKILKEDEGKRMTAFEQKQKTAFTEMERKLRVELGLESHENPPGAVVNNSDAAFLKGIADGSLPLTKANLERHEKLINS